MSLLVLDGVSLSFAERAILDRLSLRIAENDRIGLVGPNGSGKSTLLKIIAGQQAIDKGTIQTSRGVAIGYLPQDIEVEGGKTLRNFVVGSVPGREELDGHLREAEAELAAMEGGDEAELMGAAQRIADLHERIDHFERFYSEHEALTILAGLGFSDGDHGRGVEEFSGGWKMRAVLAALLFQKPDLMLLDEPTNHLDMPSVAWFSEFLKRYKQAFILISHDREFLNEQIQRIVSFESEGVRQYPGNYERYVVQRAEEEEILENKARNIAREREHMQRFIDRFRAQANKAAAVQSRVKALAKLENVELFQKRRSMRFSFPKTARAVGEVVRVEGVKKAYGDLVVFPGVDLVVRRGEKIAIIGSNGAGKTTLLKMIAGELKPDGGEIRIGNKVDLGYYAQHHADTLHRESTVYEEAMRANPDAGPARVRSVLGAFLFSGDDVDKKVAVLSGGERARVALARLLIRPGNFLLMDEPTNHLDLQSSESLAESLKSYDGTLIFVSHNRSLVRALATRIWNVEDGAVETYNGTLDEYMYSCRLRAEAEAGAAESAAVVEAAAAAGAGRNREDERARKRREAEDRRVRSQVLGPLSKRAATLEDRIEVLEKKKQESETKLADPDVYADAAQRKELLAEFQKTSEKLEELTLRWEATVEELEEKRAELDG